MRNIVYIAVVLLLSSCNVYRSFNTPTPDNTNIVGEGTTVTDSLITLPSWESYLTDPKLQQLIREALSDNSDLRIAQENIVQAEATLLSSKLAYLPSFAFAAEGGISKFDSYTTKSYTLPITTQWEIDLAGRIRNEKRQAHAQVELTRETEALIRTQLITSIANSYYTLIMLDEQLRLSNEAVKLRHSTVETMRALKDVGMQNEAAVNQAEIAYYSVCASVKELEYQIIEVQNVLALLLNKTPHAIERAELQKVSILSPAIGERISLVTLANRPDVRMAEAELGSMFYGVNIAR